MALIDMRKVQPAPVLTGSAAHIGDSSGL